MAVNLDHQRDRISTASGNITINTAGSLRIPVGNTAARPQGTNVATGQIRYNTQLNIFIPVRERAIFCDLKYLSSNFKLLSTTNISPS